MASKYWIKLYHEMLDDPKVGRLSDSMYRRFVECLLLAGELDEDGFLPPVEDMAWRLRMQEEAVKRDMSGLALAGLLELKAHEDGDRWYVSKFEERQRASDAAERMREYRKRKRKAAKEKEKEEDVDIDTDTYRTVTRVTKGNGHRNGFWDIPESIRTDDFVRAWSDWLTSVDERGIDFVETQARATLEELAKMGPSRATAAVRESTVRGWRSIYEAKPNSKATSTSKPGVQLTEVAPGVY